MQEQISLAIGFCECGCGEVTSLAPQTHRPRGLVKGRPMRYVAGHASRKNTPEYDVRDCGYTTPCWVWQRYTKRDGYGMKRRDQILMNAHVAYWMDRHGPVPEGLELDHLCRVKACVNPDHLEAVTHQENCRRRSQSKNE